MNTEDIIKNQANKFANKYHNDKHFGNSTTAFQEKLELNLKPYKESLLRLIYLYETHKKFSNFYENHIKDCKRNENPETCRFHVFYSESILFIEQEIRLLNPTFDYKVLRPEVNSDLIKKNLVDLKVFPEVSRLYLKAIDKLNEERYERNLLDDLRLSIEKLLKQILGNDKNLKNQMKGELGKYLKLKNTTPEVINMFEKLLNLYDVYQNKYVKHDDKINKDEIDLIVNLSSSMISFLLNKK